VETSCSCCSSWPAARLAQRSPPTQTQNLQSTRRRLHAGIGLSAALRVFGALWRALNLLRTVCSGRCAARVCIVLCALRSVLSALCSVLCAFSLVLAACQPLGLIGPIRAESQVQMTPEGEIFRPLFVSPLLCSLSLVTVVLSNARAQRQGHAPHSSGLANWLACCTKLPPCTTWLPTANEHGATFGLAAGSLAKQLDETLAAWLAPGA